MGPTIETGSGKTVDEVRALLEGPVDSTPTTFGPDESLDLDGVRAVIEHACARSLVVATGRRWPTGKEIGFAPYCRELGVDVYMLLPGMQMQGSPDLAIHHCAVAAVVPVMLVGCPGCTILDQLVEDARICCFKEDGTEGCAVQTMHRYEGRWRMMTGGGLRRHFTQWPFDCRAFMSQPSSFPPPRSPPRTGARCSVATSRSPCVSCAGEPDRLRGARALTAFHRSSSAASTSMTRRRIGAVASGCADPPISCRPGSAGSHPPHTWDLRSG